VAVSVLACTSQDAPPPKPAPKKADPSAWKEIETPVPVGRKVACAQIIAADKIGAAVGYPLEVIDQSMKDPDATAVCRLMTAKQGKSRKEKGSLEPGEELATLTAYCWYPFSVPEIKKRCTDQGEETSTDVGDITCVRKVRAGDQHERFVVTALEPDTRCKLVVNPGPANYDLALTKATAKALVDTIDKDSVKPPKR
jgi:hypothetical protein